MNSENDHSRIMPLYEFLRLAIEKLESSKQKPCSFDPSLETEYGFAGGPTENGKITPSVHGDATLENSVTSRNEKCGGAGGGVEYIFNEISPVLPSGDLDFTHIDRTVPWMSNPGVFSSHTPRVSAKNELAGDTFMSRRNGTGSDQAVDDLFNSQDAVKLSSLKAHSFHSWLQQKDRVSDPSILSGDYSILSNVAEREEVKEMVSASRCISPPIIMRNDVDLYVPVAPTGDGMAKDINLDTFMNIDKLLVQNNPAYSVGALAGDRATYSSVSSENSADDNERKHEKKRFHDNEELEYQSDELVNASAGVKKPSPAEGGRGSKRRRAAEVHNLSERRRRDRINQKMQTLQELIPNSNKVDKASLLDEVIEYLKNLKHQVQIMSMVSGLCVPPLMFSPGTRHMYHAPTPHFSYIVPGAHFPTSAMGLVNFQGPSGHILPMWGHPSSVLHRTVPGAPLVPLTGWHQASAMRPPSPSTSPALNHEDLIMKKNSHRVFNVEASRSIHCIHTQQLQATNDVANQSHVKNASVWS